MTRLCSCALTAALALGCGGPLGLGCEDAPAGASGTREGDALTICVREQNGTPRSGARITDGEGGSLGETDADGRIEVSGSGPFFVEHEGFLSETLVAPDSASRVVLELSLSDAPGTRSASFTVSFDGELPTLEDGAVRQAEVRASVPLSPLALIEGIDLAPLGVCEFTTDQSCRVTVEAPLAATDVSMVVVDVAEDGGRTILGIGGVPNVPDGASASVISPGRSVQLSGVPVDAVVGVPGLAVGSQVMFFGPTALDAPIPLPGEGAAWVALQHGEGGAGLGIVRRVSADSLAAPTAPTLTVGAEGVLILPSDANTRFRVSGVSAGREVWRASVYEGSIPTGLRLPADMDEVVVAAYQIEAGSPPFSAISGARRITLQ